MDARALETLLWIVRLGSVTAAAKQLHLSQPAVTRRIRGLESELGARVLRRAGRGVALTPIGEHSIASAERILGELASLRGLARDPASVFGSLRLGVAEVIALSWLHRLVTRVRKAYPLLGLELDIDLSEDLLRKLGAGRIDIAFLPGPVSLPGAITRSLGFVSLRWMASPHLLRGRKEVHPPELANMPILTPSPNAHAYAVMTAWFAGAGITPRHVSTCNSFSVLASLVRQGVGISPLPPELFRRSVRQGGLVVLPERPRLGTVEYSAAYLPGSPLPVLSSIAAFAAEESGFATAAGRAWRRSPRENMARPGEPG